MMVVKTRPYIKQTKPGMQIAYPVLSYNTMYLPPHREIHRRHLESVPVIRITLAGSEDQHSQTALPPASCS